MTANDWTAICDKPHDIRLIVADMDGENDTHSFSLHL